uniref:Chitin-binding type-2 domain-containing protein n=2 Tax=Anopheles funestus TaxID=62324 RepID=A0A182R2K0_ANOFN
MVWSIETDDFKGICGRRFTLLSALNGCVNGYKPFVCISDGFFRDPYDCNKYYRCYQGITYAFNCPPGLYFDQTTIRCDWLYNVKCA